MLYYKRFTFLLLLLLLLSSTSTAFILQEQRLFMASKKTKTTENEQGPRLDFDRIACRNFRNLRKSRQISLETLSSEIGCSTQSIYNIEHGHTNLVNGLLLKSLNYMGVNIATLFVPGFYPDEEALKGGGIMRDSSPNESLGDNVLAEVMGHVLAEEQKKETEVLKEKIRTLADENEYLKTELQEIVRTRKEDHEMLVAVYDAVKFLKENMKKENE